MSCKPSLRVVRIFVVVKLLTNFECNLGGILLLLGFFFFLDFCGLMVLDGKQSPASSSRRHCGTKALVRQVTKAAIQGRKCVSGPGS